MISRALTDREALCLPAYERVLKNAFQDKSNAPDDVEIVPIVRDWDAFYAPAMDPKFAGFAQKGQSKDVTHFFEVCPVFVQ